MNEIKELLRSFCRKHLNDELMGYALKLCDTLGKNLSRGRKEIWAASIIYVIARLNFLFDKEHENHITADTICKHFNTVKSTVGNKASQIEDACDLTFEAEEYCSKQISDSFTFYQTPEGFIIPKSMVEGPEIEFEVAEEEDVEEIEKFVEKQKKIQEQFLKEKQEERERKSREIAEKKRKERENRDYEKRQLKLFGD